MRQFAEIKHQPDTTLFKSTLSMSAKPQLPYRETLHDFAVGDRIQFTAPDKQLGVVNRDLATIESISPDGRVSTQLDDSDFSYTV